MNNQKGCFNLPRVFRAYHAEHRCESRRSRVQRKPKNSEDVFFAMQLQGVLFLHFCLGSCSSTANDGFYEPNRQRSISA